jgi:hypothetical protein
VFAGIALAAYFIAGGRIPRERVRRLGDAGSRVARAVVSAGSTLVRALVRRPGFVAAAVALAVTITAASWSTGLLAAPTRMDTSARPTCGSPVIS